MVSQLADSVVFIRYNWLARMSERSQSFQHKVFTLNAMFNIQQQVEKLRTDSYNYFPVEDDDIIMEHFLECSKTIEDYLDAIDKPDSLNCQSICLTSFLNNVTMMIDERIVTLKFEHDLEHQIISHIPNWSAIALTEIVIGSIVSVSEAVMITLDVSKVNDKMIKIEIHDDGWKIPSDHIELINKTICYLAIDQLDGNTRSYGLALARGIALAAGGEMKVESLVPEQGNIVTLQLKLDN